MDSHQLLTYVNQFAQAFPWPVLATSGVISPLLSGLKHWLQLEGDKTYKFGPLKVKGEQIIFLMLIVMTGAGVALTRFMHWQTGNHTVLVLQALATGFMTQPVYLFIVKPALRSYQASIDKQVSQRMASIIVPPTTSTTTSAATAPQRFN